MAEKTGQPKQDRHNRTAELYRQNWTGRTGLSEQNRQIRQANRTDRKRMVGFWTGRTGQTEQNRQNRRGRTGQAEQDCQNRTGKSDKQNRTDRKRKVGFWTGRTGHTEQNRQSCSRTRQAEQDS